MKGPGMAETGWTAVDFVASRHVPETDLEKSVRMARQAEARQEREDARADAERAAAAEDERERRRFAYSQLGIAGRTPDRIAADAIRAADQEDRYQDALRTVAKVQRERQADAENHRFQAEMLEHAMRGRPVTDPLELATMRAQAAADDAVRQRQAILDQAREQVRRSRPSRRSASPAASQPDEGVRYRGYAAPQGVTWSQLSEWISRGWRP